MTPAAAQKEIDRLEHCRSSYCPRCAELRQLVPDGVITHAVNCPLLVALGINDGKVVLVNGQEKAE